MVKSPKVRLVVHGGYGDYRFSVEDSNGYRYGDGHGFRTRESATKAGKAALNDARRTFKDNTVQNTTRNPRGSQVIITDAHGLAQLMRNPAIRRRVRNISETKRKPVRNGYVLLPDGGIAWEGSESPAPRTSKYQLFGGKRAVKRPVKRAATKRKPTPKRRNSFPRSRAGYVVYPSGTYKPTLAVAKKLAKRESTDYGHAGVTNERTQVEVAHYYMGRQNK